jgi:hypothetical protein
MFFRFDFPNPIISRSKGKEKTDKNRQKKGKEERPGMDWEPQPILKRIPQPILKRIQRTH